jgi:DNA-binding NtrC family response regulator
MSPARILLVDDEPDMLENCSRILSRQGHTCMTAANGREALAILERERPDLLVTDLKMPEMDGMALLRHAHELDPTLPVIMLTAFATIESAVAAVKEGAFDYLPKDFSVDQLRVAVERALRHRGLQVENRNLRQQLQQTLGLENIVGRSPAMTQVFELVKKAARSEANILVLGESGTGKELIAKAIHQHSPRRDRPFVALDCGTLPETLLESELFGHVRGAFTGAISNKKGLFEEADGGTLLLDEIADTTPAFQSKLLRALQENEIRPVGNNHLIKINVRVIASTNRDLKKDVERGTFREDLYYRLAVVPIMVPPLNRRRDDIPLLVEHFLKKYCDQNGLEAKYISPNSLRLLMNYSWPGNVRELENVIERAVLMSSGSVVNPEVYSVETEERENPLPLHQATREVTENVERQKIMEALHKAEGNRSRAARLLGISRATLYEKLKTYNLAPHN